jgi:hypothetical protein
MHIKFYVVGSWTDVYTSLIYVQHDGGYISLCKKINKYVYRLDIEYYKEFFEISELYSIALTDIVEFCILYKYEITSAIIKPGECRVSFRLDSPGPPHGVKMTPSMIDIDDYIVSWADYDRSAIFGIR